MSKLRIGWLVFACLIFGAIPIVRALMFDNDHQIANMLAVLLVFFGVLNIWVWLVTFKELGGIPRVLVFLAPAAGLAIFSSQFEFVGFSGEMVPEFRRKGVSNILPPIVADSKANDAIQSIGPEILKSGFPQLLGANRDGNIPDIHLDGDWKSHPPELIWKRPIGAAWSGFAIAGEKALTLEQVDEQESISCFELSTGSDLWKHKYPAKHYNVMGGLGPRSTPTIVDGTVYAQGATGMLFAFDLETGKVKWEKSLLELLNLDQATSEGDVMWGRSGSPLVTKDFVIVPFGGRSSNPTASLVAFEKETGKMAWQGGEDQISYASPIIATLGGTEQIVSVNEKTVGGYGMDNGDLLWSFSWPGLSNQNASVSQPIIIGQDHVLVSKGYGGGAALFKVVKEGRKWSATQVWEDTALLKTKFTSAIRHGDLVFGLSDGILECINPMTGEKYWKDRRGRYGHGQMLIVGDHCLVLSEEGELILVDAKKDGFEERGRFQVVEGTTWNIPSIVGPLVLVRNATQMACVRLQLANYTSK